MQNIQIQTCVKQILADTITPVSIYLRLRDVFPQSILLESSDYHASEDSYSFICLQPFASFVVEEGQIKRFWEGDQTNVQEINDKVTVPEELNQFIQSFKVGTPDPRIRTNGIFGYSSYDAVKYFEDIG